ncbi:MAG: tRNA (adenosine(37)-N6)-dimethylallyltransferase MiaA [Nevskia sp.]|nr:tRNA (adenosine(37)-N6)-dimethylallyltransferase MiaA [Nevskia sp.]
MPPIVAIAGPTAAGKSALALELCALWPGGAEIVSVDSAQVYRSMDIGTAKPDAATRARIPHHLIDILDPAQAYSAAAFARDAAPLVAAIRARGRLPILVGGTLLYFKALLDGLSELPAADTAVRARLEREAGKSGWAALHARLAQVDPETAARLHPNDAQRIQRALEIFELSGVPASAWFRVERTAPLAGALCIAVCPAQRPELHRRIEQRLRRMIEQGLVEEVQRLRARGDLRPDMPSMRAVGYRQLWRHLDGACTLAQAVEQAIAATRQYAKRQLTWLGGETRWSRIDPTEPNAVSKVLNLVRQAQAYGDLKASG